MNNNRREVLLLAVFIGQVILFFLFIQPGNFPRYWQNLQQSREAQLASRWSRDQYFLRTQFIVSQTTSNSTIILPSQSSGVGELGNRGLTDYFLFPRQTVHNDRLRLEEHDNPVYRVWLPDISGQKPSILLQLDEGFGLETLQTASSTPLLIIEDFVTKQPDSKDLLIVILKGILTYLAGYWIVRRYFLLRTTVGFSVNVVLVGLILNSIFYIILALLNVPVSEQLQIIWLLILSLPTFRLLKTWRFPKAHIDLPSMLAALPVVTFFSYMSYVSMVKPIITWDAVAIWGIKARAIYSFHSLRATALWGAWPEYPPLVPVIMAQLGTAGESSAKLLFPLLGFCLYGLLYEALAALRLPSWLHILLPLAPLLSPLVFEHTQIAYANLALTVYLTWTFLLWWGWLRSGGKVDLFPPLAIALCGVTLARPDGEVYSAYLLVLSLMWVLLHKRSPRTLRPILGWIVLPIGVNLLWKTVYTLHIKQTADYSFFGVASQGQLLAKLALTSIPSPSQLAEVFLSFGQYSLDPHYWGLIPILVLVLIFVKLVHHLTTQKSTLLTDQTEWLWSFLLLSLLGLFILSVYIGPQWGVEHYFRVSFVRLFMVLVPIFFIWIVEVISKSDAVLANHGDY